MFFKQFVPEFPSQARTLDPCEVFGPKHGYEVGEFSYTHESAWTIKGVICEDYYYWVNYFEASHPTFGKVWGNFEDEVFADSEEAFAHFIEHHAPNEWDYWDI